MPAIWIMKEKPASRMKASDRAREREQAKPIRATPKPIEALPIQETMEAIEELQQLDLPIGSVIVNRNIPPFLPAPDLAKAARPGHFVIIRHREGGA